MFETVQPKQTLPKIIDPTEVRIAYCDCIVTIGLGPTPGMANIVLGTMDHTHVHRPTDRANIVVAAKLRFTIDFLQNLHAQIGSILDSLDTREQR
jgi:hypothetical protein